MLGRLTKTGPVETTTTDVEDTTETVFEEAIDLVSEDAAELCVGMGPQTPRVISSVAGLNSATFPQAPPSGAMNLCNILGRFSSSPMSVSVLAPPGDISH